MGYFIQISRVRSRQFTLEIGDSGKAKFGLIFLDGVTVTIQIIAFETKMDCNKTAFSYDTSRTSSLIYII